MLTGGCVDTNSNPLLGQRETSDKHVAGVKSPVETVVDTPTSGDDGSGQACPLMRARFKIVGGMCCA